MLEHDDLAVVPQPIAGQIDDLLGSSAQGMLGGLCGLFGDR